MNIVPKTGGNSRPARSSTAAPASRSQADNFTARRSRPRAFRRRSPFTRSTTSTARSAARSRRIASGSSSTRARRAARRRLRTSTTTRMPATRPSGCTAPDLSQAGILRSHLEQRQRAPHLAGHAAQQDRRLLGRAGVCRKCTGPTTGITDPARVVSPEAAAPVQTKPLRVPQVDLVVAGDEPAAARRGVRRHLLRLGQLRTRPESRPAI